MALKFRIGTTESLITNHDEKPVGGNPRNHMTIVAEGHTAQRLAAYVQLLKVLLRWLLLDAQLLVVVVMVLLLLVLLFRLPRFVFRSTCWYYFVSLTYC